MQERQRIVATGLVLLLLVLWLGFLIHRSPRFPGSSFGGVLGITGTLLMLVPLVYMLIKRITPLRKAVTKWVSMRTLLAWHIYAGIVGPILVLLHTGHKFDSNLGRCLTAMTLIVTFSGFLGRYLMTQISSDITEKKNMLNTLEGTYRQAVNELTKRPWKPVPLRPFSGVFSNVLAYLFIPTPETEQRDPAVLTHTAQVVESIADLEYSIKTEETFKRLFAKWLKLHITIAMVLYALLALHVWAGIYFGLRWFE